MLTGDMSYSQIRRLTYIPWTLALKSIHRAFRQETLYNMAARPTTSENISVQGGANRSVADSASVVAGTLSVNTYEGLNKRRHVFQNEKKRRKKRRRKK